MVVVIRITIAFLVEKEVRVMEEACSPAFHHVEDIDAHSAALQIARLVHLGRNLDTTPTPDQKTAISGAGEGKAAGCIPPAPM
jgi:hypothetical protein